MMTQTAHSSSHAARVTDAALFETSSKSSRLCRGIARLFLIAIDMGELGGAVAGRLGRLLGFILGLPFIGLSLLGMFLYFVIYQAFMRGTDSKRESVASV